MIWLRGLGYYLMQRLTLLIVNKWANVVYVTSIPEVKYFPKKRVIVVKGGVNIPHKQGYRWEAWHSAIFIGRFHYQKGVLKLIDIWSKVNKVLPSATLKMVGEGVLLKKCIKKRNSLGANITFLPFTDGIGKEKYIRESKIILHPATYDSGGMACAEGMAYGLPAVGFDLEAHKTYYAKGMIKVNTIQQFADEIVKLLTDREYYNYWSKEARDYTVKEWDWDKRAEEIYVESDCFPKERNG